MSSGSRAALVTGANKGIGYEIVRQLSPKFAGTVYLTARDQERGQAAEKALLAEGLSNVKFLQLDVGDKKSIEKACEAIKSTHGGLDVLVNNAGIASFDPSSTGEPSLASVKSTLATNFTGLLDVCNAFFPILRPHARVVNVSSNLGCLRLLSSDDLKAKLVANDLTVPQLENIIDDYIKACGKGNATEVGYPSKFGPYAMSKIGVTALSRVQQRAFDQDKARPDIVVNAVCPGYCATDLNHNSGPKTSAVGAESPVYLALLPASKGDEAVKPRGEFVYEKTVLDWAKGELPADGHMDAYIKK